MGSWSAPADQPDTTRTIRHRESYPPRQYQRGTHFVQLEERGSKVPLWRAASNLVEFDGVFGPVTRTAVPGVDGAFILSHVLSSRECDQLRHLTETMGYLPERTAAGRSTRTNEQCVWVADDTVWTPVWQRIATYMPPVQSSRNGYQERDGALRLPLGLNQRWRCYKYGEECDFSRHHDSSWCALRSCEGGVRLPTVREPLGRRGSALDANGNFLRDAWCGQRQSELTVLLYLNDLDTYEGGETTFFEPGAEAVLRAVRVAQGSILCFFHGSHPLSPLHEGSRVTQGVKHVIRTDVLYPTGSASAELTGVEDGDCVAAFCNDFLA